MFGFIERLVKRSKVAYHETVKRTRAFFGIGFVATVVGRAVTQHWGKSRMTWKEVLVDLGIYGSICAALFTVMFIYNFIRAPKIMKKLEEERKRKAGLASLNQVLAEEHKRISEEIDEVLDADEEAHEREAQERNE